jgi:energy-coupling factor transporter ATP-binding protein EcfA2
MRKYHIALLLSLLLLPYYVSAESLPQVSITITDEAMTGQSNPLALFRFGAGVWRVPGAFEWMEPQIWQANQKAGTYRLALAWEILAPSKNLEDLKKRLKNYPLNAFAQKVSARGGTLIICIDAMPRWLAANDSARMMSDGPAWAKSPPHDYARWSQVVSAIVEHFNGNLHLSPYYEIWNEPDWAWQGNMADFFNLYRVSAIGALTADPKAKVGGPAVSDWSATGTANNKSPDKTFLQQLFQYASQTPLIPFKRARLPMDMVSWHAYTRDPAHYYALVVPAIRQWLQDAGYPASTHLVIDEWNVYPEPPYPEGDLNGNHVGAALVASTLLSMWEAGLDHQSFQLIADPGTDGYTGGVFTTFAVPRTNWSSFQLLSMINGKPMVTKSSAPWTRSATFRDGNTWYVLVSNFVPTDQMMLQALLEPVNVKNPRLATTLRQLGQQQLVGFFMKGGAVPSSLAPHEQNFILNIRKQYQDLLAQKKQWRNGIDVSLRLPKLPFETRVTRYLIDAEHTASSERLANTRAMLEKKIKIIAQQMDKYLATEKVETELATSFRQEIREQLRVDQTVANASPAQADAVRRVYGQVRSDYGNMLKQALEENHSALYQDTLSISGLDTIKITAQPYSVQLLVLKVSAPQKSKR